MKDRKITHRYSGPKSKSFWDRVNALPDAAQEAMYAMGCILQNTEGFVLNCLNNYEQDVKENPETESAAGGQQPKVIIKYRNQFGGVAKEGSKE